MSLPKPNLDIANADIIILSSDAEMQALEEWIALACPEREFRFAIEGVLKRVVEMCVTRRKAKPQIDRFSNTAWFSITLPDELFYKHHLRYVVDREGVVTVVDGRKDKRTMRQLAADLANNLCEQLAHYELYDKQGKLMFEYEPRVPFTSLEIRLRRIR